MNDQQQIQLINQATRIADSLEKLASEQSMIEIEPSPPVCPFCNSLDPPLAVESEVGTGPASEFILVAMCINCNKDIYGVVNHWIFHANLESATDNIKYIKERQGKLNVVSG